MAILAKKLGLSDETVDLDDVVLWFHCQEKKRAVQKFILTLEGIHANFRATLPSLLALNTLSYDVSLANNVREHVPRCAQKLTHISELQCEKFSSSLASLRNFLSKYYDIDADVKLRHREIGRDYQKLLRSNEIADSAEIQAKQAFDNVHRELKARIREFLYGQDCWQTLVDMLREWKVQWAASDTELLDLAQRLSQAERLDRPKAPLRDTACPYCTSLPAWERRLSTAPPPSPEHSQNDDEQVDVDGLQDNEFDPEFAQFDLVAPLITEVRALRDAFKQVPLVLKAWVLAHDSLRDDLEAIKQREDLGCEEMEMLPRPTTEVNEDSFSGPTPNLTRSYIASRDDSRENSLLAFPEISCVTIEDPELNLDSTLIEYEEIEEKGSKIVMCKISKEDSRFIKRSASALPLDLGLALSVVEADVPLHSESKSPLAAEGTQELGAEPQVVSFKTHSQSSRPPSPQPRPNLPSSTPQTTPTIARSRPRSESSPTKGSKVKRSHERTLSASSLPLFTGKVKTLDFLDTYQQSLASSVALLDDNDISFVAELDEVLSSLDILNEIYEKAKRLKAQFQSCRRQYEAKHFKETQEQEKVRRELLQKNERLRSLLLTKAKRAYLKEKEAVRKLQMKSDAGLWAAFYKKTEEVRAQTLAKRMQKMEQLKIEIRKLTAEGPAHTKWMSFSAHKNHLITFCF